MIHNVEELCEAVGCTLRESELAQKKIESILDYLIEWGVINQYSADKIDWIFSDEQSF